MGRRFELAGGRFARCRKQGLNVVAAPIPLTSLSDDAAALRRTIARTQGPVHRGGTRLCRSRDCNGARRAREGAGVCRGPGAGRRRDRGPGLLPGRAASKGAATCSGCGWIHLDAGRRIRKRFRAERHGGAACVVPRGAAADLGQEHSGTSRARRPGRRSRRGIWSRKKTG